MSNNRRSNGSLPSMGSAAVRMLRDLRAVENLVARIEITAPETCEHNGGAQAIFNALGGGPTCIGYWRLDLAASAAGVALWEAMAGEHQARQRGNSVEREISYASRLA